MGVKLGEIVMSIRCQAAVMSLKIKRKISFANRHYCNLNRQLSSRAISRTTKLIHYKMLILHVLLYDAEAWTLLSNNVAVLRVFER